MDRAQYLAWAKRRALQYVAQGDLADAFQSFLSDMSKHDQLENHIGFKVVNPQYDQREGYYGGSISF